MSLRIICQRYFYFIVMFFMTIYLLSPVVSALTFIQDEFSVFVNSISALVVFGFMIFWYKKRKVDTMSYLIFFILFLVVFLQVVQVSFISLIFMDLQNYDITIIILVLTAALLGVILYFGYKGPEFKELITTRWRDLDRYIIYFAFIIMFVNYISVVGFSTLYRIIRGSGQVTTIAQGNEIIILLLMVMTVVNILVNINSSFIKLFNLLSSILALLLMYTRSVLQNLNLITPSYFTPEINYIEAFVGVQLTLTFLLISSLIVFKLLYYKQSITK